MSLTSHQVAGALELLARKLKEAPEFRTDFDSVAIVDYITPSNKDLFLEMAKSLRPLKKTFGKEDFDLVYEVSEGGLTARMRYWGPRSLVCRKVQEEKWECDPLLTPDEEKQIEDATNSITASAPQQGKLL